VTVLGRNPFTAQLAAFLAVGGGAGGRRPREPPQHPRHLPQLGRLVPLYETKRPN
jgi:hypothetical protein